MPKLNEFSSIKLKSYIEDCRRYTTSMYRCLSNNTMHTYIIYYRFYHSKSVFTFKCIYKISRADIFPLRNFYSTNFFLSNFFFSLQIFWFCYIRETFIRNVKMKICFLILIYVWKEHISIETEIEESGHCKMCLQQKVKTQQFKK